MPRTQVRPGQEIKAVLSGQIPWRDTSERRDSASVQELYSHYKYQIWIARQMSKGIGGHAIRQKGMCRDSFGKLIYMAKRLDLIREVARGDSIWGTERGPLLMINGHLDPRSAVPIDEREVVESVPIYYALTSAGQTNTAAWDNLRRAYGRLVQ